MICKNADASIIELNTEEDFVEKGSIRNGKIVYCAKIDTRVMLETGHLYSLNIGGIECGNGNDGIYLSANIIESGM